MGRSMVLGFSRVGGAVSVVVKAVGVGAVAVEVVALSYETDASIVDER